MLQQAVGERTAAAEQLTAALRLDPKMLRAAQRLGDILSLGILPGKPRLDEAGLAAALTFDRVDRDLIAASALHHLVGNTILSNALQRGPIEGWDAVARRLCVKRTHELLENSLLLAILEAGTITRFDIERLLTELRRILLLELPRERFADRRLARFSVALMRQSWLNEFAWFETPEETQRLNSDPGSALRFLYRCPGPAASGRDQIDEASGVLASAIGAALNEHRALAADIRRRADRMPSLSPLADDTSRKVAEMYEQSPYPRWTSVPVYPESRVIEHMRRYFRSAELAFADKPFDVLVAGCGTGRQAVSAALDYGDKASITGFDISRSSLGYASMMADRMQVGNMTLAHGDLNHVLEFTPSFRDRFQIVECGGVLHHMAEPFAAWRKLIACLAPGGIMMIALYSRTARRNLERLKAEPVYPGAGASDDALRSYRRTLLERQGMWPGSEFMRSRDTYSLSGFRDYFMHVSERTTDLLEIKEFLGENGLRFRGFVDLPVEALQTTHPDARSPGDLEQWHAWEQQHPHAFSGMYQFYCTRS